jgi:hypothetical protein
MNVKRLVTSTLAALALPLSASAGSLIIPAAGTGPGANGSHWKSEVIIANLSLSPANLTLLFHDSTGVAGTSTLTLAARSTVADDDIVATRFNRTSATGAIEIQAADTSKLVVSSRTYNESTTGRFGQDIPAFDASTLIANSNSVLLAPADVIEQRFNFGIYAASDATVQWTLLRADGTTAATIELQYTAGQQIQYNGLPAVFGLDAKAQNLDSVQALFKSGTGVVYGSAIENQSGDPSFVRGIEAKPDTQIHFLGVDRLESGVVDYPDANHDGTVDQPIDLVTSLFPNFFRIVVDTPTGAKVQFELVDAGPNVTLVDDNGTVEWAPGGNLRGSTGALKVRATAGGDTTILTIPVNFK